MESWFVASKDRRAAIESPDLGGGFEAFAYAVKQPTQVAFD